MRRLLLALLAAPLLLGGGAARGGCCEPLNAFDAQWFPDGGSLLYVEAYGDGPGPVLVRALGSTRDRTIVPLAYAGALSPDGRRVAVVRYEDRALVLVDLATGAQQVVGQAQRDRPRWSPDGRYLVYGAADGLRLLDLGTGIQTPLGPGSDPSWAPDGTRLVVRADGLRVVGLDGSRTLLVAGDAQEATWSPAGDWIAFTRYADSDGTIWLVRPDGTGAHALRAHADRPSWSPDGTRLAAMLTDRGELYGGGLGMTVGQGELGVVAMDGTARGLGALAFRGAAWSRDGTRIAFEADAGNGEGIEIVGANGRGLVNFAWGCTSAASPPLTGCSSFGGQSVPVRYAPRPLRIHVNNQNGPLREPVWLQIAVRDRDGRRVRGARVSFAVAPRGAARVKSSWPYTDDDGVLAVDLVPHGRLPRGLRLTIRAGGAVAVFSCRELGISRRRGC